MKKNNKGFSLVELIVVVLIMGIIAVALAPQVMKWVGTARDNSDKNTGKDIKSAIQVAVADAQNRGYVPSATSSIAFTSAGVASLGNSALIDAITEVTGGDYSATKANGGTFSFEIDGNGVVTVY